MVWSQFILFIISCCWWLSSWARILQHPGNVVETMEAPFPYAKRSLNCVSGSDLTCVVPKKKNSDGGGLFVFHDCITGSALYQYTSRLIRFAPTAFLPMFSGY